MSGAGSARAAVMDHIMASHAEVETLYRLDRDVGFDPWRPAAPEALEFSVEYAGVVVFGKGRVVEDQDEARTALQMLLDRYAPHLRPGVDYRATTDDELKRTAVYRIDIEAWSGKQKEVPEDFPGAFALDPPPVPFPGWGE